MNALAGKLNTIYAGKLNTIYAGKLNAIYAGKLNTICCWFSVDMAIIVGVITVMEIYRQTI